MTVQFNATRDETRLISLIVKRAREAAPAAAAVHSTLDLSMSLDACHSSGCALDLVGLHEAADVVSLVHDVFGIHRHLDRTTGKLKDHFRPRYAA